MQLILRIDQLHGILFLLKGMSPKTTPPGDCPELKK